MPATALLGLQWGDEGKGKVVDALSKNLQMIVRAQGGANAGHTVRVGGQKHVLHLVPSGILYPHVVGLIGHGVVVDPVTLVREIRQLESLGVDLDGRLFVSERAHVVLPSHKALDVAQEAARGAGRIGTTGRGIGPAYGDKVGRKGIPLGASRHPSRFAERVRELTEEKNRLLTALGAEPLDVSAAVAAIVESVAVLAPRITDTVALVLSALDRGDDVLLEGAQGALLDLDLGSYPYVTSSNCHVGGLITGSGVPPQAIGRVIGVTKAYCTRVGEGPFPTEEFGPIGAGLRERGQEFGATTGRPRRCGWFDAVAVRQAVRTNGVTEIALTKTDVLAGEPVIRVGTAYTSLPTMADGEPVDPTQAPTVRYTDLPGFDADLATVRRYDDLPGAVRDFVAFLESVCGVPVTLVSTGPERTQTLSRGHA